MKMKTNLIKESRIARFPYSPTIKSLIISALFLTVIQGTLKAQDSTYTRPSWWFGVAGGANLNFYRGSTQELNSSFTAPATFHNGFGVGLFVAPLIEYYRPNALLGVMLQLGYDNRKGSSDEIRTPCNCPADLDADISYITVEPSLRINPFKSNFYLYVGPRLAFNLQKSFTYQLGINPAYPNQATTPAVTGDLSMINKTLLSMQVGAGYDIQLSSLDHKTQFVLSPFVSYQPYFGQNPRSIETLNITTLRVGAAFKFGSGHKNEPKAELTLENIVPIIVAATDTTVTAESDVYFFVNSPENIPTQRQVRETFPLRNYIFFDLGSNKIPSRYVLITKEQVPLFKEEQLEVFTPKELSGRSGREMVVYYNILNILGDRMGKYPTSKIVLVGASDNGRTEGLLMGESIKRYLVDIFGISASRIKVEGRNKPKISSEQPGGTKELVMLREDDHRVSIESSSPALLMEFVSGPEAPLKPVIIAGVEEAPIESYVVFNVMDATEILTSWSIEVMDDKGNGQNFGPYTEEQMSVPGKTLMGNNPEGDYLVTMIGTSRNGKVIRKEATVHMVQWTPPVDEETTRFNIIYEFNQSKAIMIYDKYLSEIVTPKIPKGGTVIIQGHTDAIGSEKNNLRLSLARANDVKSILVKSLQKAGRNDVKFEVIGFGENQEFAPFENNLPEERFYNRSVIIDITIRK